ncbi:MAG: pilus assembly protein [Burkholderiaceae bacterium]|nr:pilus assembly protein [Burkholderiaceae bacterium]
MSISDRYLAASKAALYHFLGTLVAAACAGVLVLLVWYPYPYSQLSGGSQLFQILLGVGIVCGPLLTLVLFNPRKSRRELFADLSLVMLVQLAALWYGMHTAYQARPLFLVHEVDRFRVIALPDYQGADVGQELAALEPLLRPRWSVGPVTVGTRNPRNSEEQQEVMLDALAGGRDYAQRPEFYIPYDAAYLPTALARAKPLKTFTDHYPQTVAGATELLRRAALAKDQALFLPVLHRQEWVAVMDAQSRIVGFLPGDGFAVP